MPSVLRAGVRLAVFAALAVAVPAFASSEIAACADGVGGRWIAERIGGLEETQLRLTHLRLDGGRDAAVTVRRTGADRMLSAQLRCDGQGGAWLAWSEIDHAAMTTEVRAAHAGRDGALLARGESALASFFDLFDAVSLLADGRGGVYVAWREADASHERRVRLCRLGADGAAARGWPERGLTLEQPRGNVRPRLVTDGEGGAIVVADADPNVAGATAFALRVSPDAALLR